jgi:hypothetical protein
VGDQLNQFVEALHEAHQDNLRSVVLYGSQAVSVGEDAGGAKNILVVLDRITPHDLHRAHWVAEDWRRQGHPLPVYFTSREVKDSSDVFPIEFLDMSKARRVLYGDDPFADLLIPTHNLRHQLEYELRGKLLRLRTIYITASEKPDRLAKLMADSLSSFAVLFRHVLEMQGASAPADKREAVNKLADLLGLDKHVFARVFEYEADEDVWLEVETNETFSGYLAQIERVIEVVNH